MPNRVTLKSRLPEISAEMRPRISRAVKEGAEEIADAARRNLEAGGHVDSGDLLNSVHVERAGAGQYRVVADARAEKNGKLGAGAPYGVFVEFGTSDTSAYPFMIPAADEKSDGIVDAVQVVLRTL
jgi:HK97 gp10 family phage protein